MKECTHFQIIPENPRKLVNWKNYLIVNTRLISCTKRLLKMNVTMQKICVTFEEVGYWKYTNGMCQGSGRNSRDEVNFFKNKLLDLKNTKMLTN